MKYPVHLRNVNVLNVDLGLLNQLKNLEMRQNRVFSAAHVINNGSYYDFVNDAVSDYFAYGSYLAHTDGADEPTIDCPSCGDGIYIMCEGICASCGFAASHSCSRCGCNIPPSEVNEGDLCGYCSYMYEKIMSE